MRGTADAGSRAPSCKIQAAQEDVSHLGAAVRTKAEELSREDCQGDVGLRVGEASTIPWSGMLP